MFLLVLAAFGNVGSYIAKTPPEHTFLLHCASDPTILVYIVVIPVHTDSNSYWFQFVLVPVHTGGSSYWFQFILIPVHTDSSSV